MIIGSPLTASARRIRFSRANPPKLKEESWQDRAWEVYDRLGEVFFMTRYRRGIAAKVDYFVAEQASAMDDPEPLEAGPAVEIFEAEGGPKMMKRIISALMPHWDVPGEGYLVGFDEAPRWRILSTQELKKHKDRFMVWLDEDGKEVGQIEEDMVYRIWSPHPRFSKRADSPTKHILEPAEELILLGREIRARSISRLPAGVWMIPEGLDLEAFEEEDGSGLDGFATELSRKMSRPVADPGDPQALTPWIIEMPREDIEAAAKGLVSFARDFRTSSEHRKELLVRLATGLDLPAEIFLGLADVNHWGQWLITEHAVSRHAAPSIDEMLDSLTMNWFLPLLEANSVETEGIVLWRDLSPATVPTDRSDLTLEAHDRFLISDEAARIQLDFDEADAPSEEEIAARVAREQARRSSSPSVSAGPPSTDRPGMALTAADVETVLASELADIDRSLLTWTVAQAESALERVTERVGQRLKGLAERNGARDAVRGAEPSRVASILGPTQITLLAQGERLVGPEDFESFAARLRARITSAWEAARKFVERLTGEEAPPVPEADIGDGTDLIIAGLVAAVEASLFGSDAAPDPADLGEIPDSLVPIDRIREGLSVAGGGLPVFDGAIAEELVGNGRTISQTLGQRGWRSLSYRWSYGDPSARAVNFEPHQALDGLSVASWEDESLRVFGGFPRREFYRPGDHRGCQCSYVRLLTVTVPVPTAIG